MNLYEIQMKFRRELRQKFRHKFRQSLDNHEIIESNLGGVLNTSKFT